MAQSRSDPKEDHFLKDGGSRILKEMGLWENCPKIIGSQMISSWAISFFKHYLWCGHVTRLLSELINVQFPLRLSNKRFLTSIIGKWDFKTFDFTEKFYCHDPYKDLSASRDVFPIWVIAHDWPILKGREIEGYCRLLSC